MVAAGLLAAVVALGLRLDPFIVIGGVMLAVSGAIKLVMLRLWREIGPPAAASSTTSHRQP